MDIYFDNKPKKSVFLRFPWLRRTLAGVLAAALTVSAVVMGGQIARVRGAAETGQTDAGQTETSPEPSVPDAPAAAEKEYEEIRVTAPWDRDALADRMAATREQNAPTPFETKLAEVSEAIETEAERRITLLADTDEAITVTTSMTVERKDGAAADSLTAGTGIVRRVTNEAYKFYYEGFAIAYDGKTAAVEYHFTSAMTGKLLIAAYDSAGRMIGLTSAAIDGAEDGTAAAALTTKGTVAGIRVFFVADATYAPLHEQKSLTI